VLFLKYTHALSLQATSALSAMDDTSTICHGQHHPTAGNQCLSEHSTSTFNKRKIDHRILEATSSDFNQNRIAIVVDVDLLNVTVTPVQYVEITSVSPARYQNGGRPRSTMPRTGAMRLDNRQKPGGCVL
jgi:hypothetical protein